MSRSLNCRKYSMFASRGLAMVLAVGGAARCGSSDNVVTPPGDSGGSSGTSTSGTSTSGTSSSGTNSSGTSTSGTSTSGTSSSGTSSSGSSSSGSDGGIVDTFGRPRHISIDPDNWVLKNTPEMQVRIAILRGQQLVAEGDTPGALAEYQKALTANPNSSLASYRIGEVLFNQRNYRPLRMRIAMRSAGTTSPSGPKSGATSRWEKYSTSPASVTGQSTNTGRRCRPTTTPKERSTKPANICNNPTRDRILTNSVNGTSRARDLSAKVSRQET